MALIIFVGGVAFVISFLIYNYIRNSNYARQKVNKIKKAESELKSAREIEKHLRDEITILQNKLRETFEDPLTNLLGWKLFEDRLGQSIKVSERYQLTMGVLYVDINDFKFINNAISFDIGNFLLQEVAQRLQSCIRQVDCVSRFSKDTFVILLSQLTKPEAAALVAQRMLNAISQPCEIRGHELYVTASIGIALYPNDGSDATTVLRSADHALRAAKQKGKNIYQFYQKGMHIKSQRELSLCTSLSHESAFQEFVLYYQPVVNVENETVICMDALLHWQHPEFGLIRPKELSSLAERQRKQNAISEWLLRNACKQFLYWRSLGFNSEFLGIQISTKQLENSHFVCCISQVLQEMQFNPQWILLEVKEDSSPPSFDMLEKAFNMLQYLGIKIALDDFGADSDPLRYIKNLNINYLKLDKSFVEDIISNQQTIALVKSILFLAQNMSMRVIIQGIESDQQAAVLKEIGCTLMQGQLLGGLLSEHEVTKTYATLSE